ncbi:DUF1513 domain-containing protein [Zavarzinia sp. CC-PAN008]|uniref:DUF1513 domain-containing protein n=1 Tax=Zavarzinia sp. CC-PAN008 TaxID=3243332 RepID=UPI003F74A2A8
MIPTRRTVLGWTASLGVLALAPRRPRAAPRRIHVSAGAIGDRFVALAFDSAGTILWTADLPGRGHGLAERPASPEVVFPARRPGRFGLVLDARDGSPLARFEASPARHFFGHAAFDGGGCLLTTENDLDTGRGLVGRRDPAAGYALVETWDSGGTGPHEIVAMPDGQALTIANGGIETRPDTGRAVLNPGEVVSGIADLGPRGRIAADALVDLPQGTLSLRHLVVLADGSVAFGLQAVGLLDGPAPLVGLWDHQRLHLLDAPAGALDGFASYVGGIEADASGTVIAATSPLGGALALWSVPERRFLGAASLPDVSGVAPLGEPGAFIATTGGGLIARVAPASSGLDVRVLARHGLRFDNHIRTLVI